MFVVLVKRNTCVKTCLSFKKNVIKVLTNYGLHRPVADEISSSPLHCCEMFFLILYQTEEGSEVKVLSSEWIFGT